MNRKPARPTSRPRPTSQHPGSRRPASPSTNRSARADAPPSRPLIDLPRPAPLTPPPEFSTEASSIGVEFESGDLDRLGLYLALLLAANEQMNLTAVTDAHEIWRRHILDSLTLLPVLADLPEGARVIDIGSGGGLPGIPLAICLPHLRFTLLEATAKKAAFLERIANADMLALANVTVLAQRAERAAHDRGERAQTHNAGTSRTGGHREAYDAVIARAVGRLPTLAELTAPFARIGGRIALIKGEQADAELEEAAPALHLLKITHATTIPTPTGRILVLEKSSATPRVYPRADGEPKRTPLGVVRPKRSES